MGCLSLVYVWMLNTACAMLWMLGCFASFEAWAETEVHPHAIGSFSPCLRLNITAGLFQGGSRLRSTCRSGYFYAPWNSTIVLVCTSSVFSLAVCSWILVLYLPALCKPHPFAEVIQDNYTFKSTRLLPNHALTKGRCCEFSMELCSKSTMCRRGVRCIIKLPPCLL